MTAMIEDLPRLDSSTANQFVKETERGPQRGVVIEPIREQQRLAGMVPDEDPETHLAMKGGKTKVQVGGQELEVPRAPCTFLPPPKGALVRFVCGVQDSAPYANFTILGVTFMRRKFEIVPQGEGTMPEQRIVPNIIELAPNQARAIEIVARRTTVTGLVPTDQRAPGKFDPDAQDTVGRGGVVYERRTAPIAAYLIFHPVREEADLNSEIDRLKAENDRMAAELAVAREAESKIARAIPTPRK